MTNAPTLTTYSGNNLVPITSKAPVIKALHTKANAKTKMNTSTMASKQKATKQKPIDLLRSILSSNSSTSSDSSKTDDSSSQSQTTTTTTTKSTPTPPQHKILTFQKPSDDDIAAYDLETVKAIRSNNVDHLRKLWSQGKSMDACNQFGESVLHMACRRGYSKIVDFLLREVKVRTDRCDDFGRNPFHDALWTPTPNFDVVDLLIDYADPSLMLSEDVRGNTPFAYARCDHNNQWITFLEKRRGMLVDRTSSLLMDVPPMKIEAVAVAIVG